jgi:hypothetical protein
MCHDIRPAGSVTNVVDADRSRDASRILRQLSVKPYSAVGVVL